MLNEELFLKLVSENNGFQVALGFIDFEDHFIGGKDSTVWYFVRKGSTDDYYIGTSDGNTWSDTHYTFRNKELSSEPAPSGETIARILSELSTGQDEIEKSGRKPSQTEIYEHPCSHYSFAFGERAYKISDEYGITVSYSNIKDEAAGFRMRSILTGEDVKAPEGA